MTLRNRRLRRGVVAAGPLLAALALAASASAHAIMSPAVAKAKALQQFTLSVPTEKENLTTTRIELTVPAGFSIDSFEPPPAPWKQQVQSTGSGESAVVQKVTWTGGKTPTEQDSVFRFNASVDKAKTYLFDVRQTYSDGSVVEWSAPSESSDTPAPRVEALSSFASGGTPILSIVALVVSVFALIVGIVALVARGGGRPLA
jgi:uncharacterized protein YcnI